MVCRLARAPKYMWRPENYGLMDPKPQGGVLNGLNWVRNRNILDSNKASLIRGGWAMQLTTILRQVPNPRGK